MDAVLSGVASAWQKLRSLVFTHYGTMTAGGLIAFAQNCPSLRHVQVLFISPQLGVEELQMVAQAVPRLSVTAPTYSVPKYERC
jgi:hypothetical protein